MGGNAIFDGIRSDRIVIRNHASREHHLDRICKLIDGINSGIRHSPSNDWLWPVDQPIEHYLAGSTVQLFDLAIPTDALIKVKDTFGDIDIQFDKTRTKDVTDWLSGISAVGMFLLVGWEKTVDTIVTIWTDTVTNKNYQLDLEMVEFKGQFPSEWARFSRSSSWDDMQLGIKGFAHKYIFRAITGKDLIVTNVQLKTKIKPSLIAPIVFSPKGARKKWKPVGVNVWQEIPMDESALINNVDDVFELFFEGRPTPEERCMMYSYVGVVELIKKYIDKKDHKAILDGLFNLMWAPRAQEIVRDDRYEDCRIKYVAFDYLFRALDICGSSLEWDKLMQEYYESF